MAVLGWESSSTSHRVTVREASEFERGSFKQKRLGDGITVVLGKLEGQKKLVVQMAVFDAEHFKTESDAKVAWTKQAPEVDKEYDSRSGTDLDLSDVGGFHKRAVAVTAEPGGASGSLEPTDEELVEINKFTQTPKTKDDVAVFRIRACNDIIDRDVDRFTPDAVRAFASLEGTLSPVGKSYMVGHDYTKLGVGRVFAAEAIEEDGVTWLRTKVYIPKTAQYENFIENIDFGVYWAVSVGVVFGASSCSVGKEHDWGWHPYVCQDGHLKGERYDPNSEETDSWGYPEPQADGKLCWRNLSEPQDFYELSQVYLGAQYYAQMEKHAKSVVVKGVSRELPELEHQVLTLPHDAKLPLTPADQAEADGFAPAWDEDNSVYKWVDGEGLIYTYQPGQEEALCLGKSTSENGDGSDQEVPVDDDETEVEAEAEVDEEEDDSEDSEAKAALIKQLGEIQAKVDGIPAEKSGDADDLIHALNATLSSALSALEDGDTDKASELLGSASGVLNRVMETLGLVEAAETAEDGEEPTLDNKDTEDEMSKSALLEAAKTAGLSKLLPVLERAEGEDVAEVLKAVEADREALTKQVADLAPKAALGEQYIKEQRAEAIDWYVKATQDPQAPKAVSTTAIERLLSLAGDDVEIVKELATQYRDLARAKFPGAVRRSSFPDNANERTEIDAPAEVDTSAAKRIHG